MGGRLIITVALVIGALAALGGPAAAQSPAPVTVNVFPGGFNWPIWAAQEKGFFAQENLAVTLALTPNSVSQMTDLSQGKCDMAMTAIDNIVAYVEGQGEAPIGPQPDFFAFMGSDNGFLSLVTVPEVQTVSALKGRTLSVDAATTGYAFVLFEILKRGGLAESDYKIEKAGGVLQRWDALKEKKHAGTILLTPFEILAKAQGFNQVAWAPKVLGAYQGGVGASRRSWAQANREKIVGYTRGYVRGVDWLYAPGNKEEALRILQKNLPQMSPALAEQSYAVMLDAKDGFFRGAKMDIEGVKTVLAMRSQYGEPKKVLSDPMTYYDPSYYEAAIRSP
jgi:ABC-type nitrate/sulfonate/bicarbonate transport system substrate-binding protein